MRAPRRPQVLAKQRNSRGSGPAGPENFGYFPSLESSPPAGGISPKKRNRGFAAAAASFFLSDQKETKESPGASFVRKALRLRLALSLTIPPDPHFYGSVEGVPRHLRPARCPHEQCLIVIAAALLNRRDRYFYKMICA